MAGAGWHGEHDPRHDNRGSARDRGAHRPPESPPHRTVPYGRTDRPARRPGESGLYGRPTGRAEPVVRSDPAWQAPSGTYRQIGPEPRTRRRSGPPVGAIVAVATALLVLGAGGVVALVPGAGARVAGLLGAACDGPEVLRLVVTPEASPVVEQAAHDLADEDGAGCPPVQVTALPAPEAAAAIEAGEADGWVPSSLAWLQVNGAARTRLDDEAVSLMRTPIVVAAPRQAAESWGWPKKQLTWSEITALTTTGAIPRISMEDPLRTSTGLLAVSAVHSAMNQSTTDAGVARMRALTLRSRLASAEADVPALLHQMSMQLSPAAALGTIGMFPAPEQAIWAYQRGDHVVDMVAIYPTDGLFEADYPLVLTAEASLARSRRAVVDRLAGRMHSIEFAGTLLRNGFRPTTEATSGDAEAADPLAAQPLHGDGLLSVLPAAKTIPPDVPTMGELASQWAKYKRIPANVLMLIDSSGSMNDEVRTADGKVTTKAALLRAASGPAIQLFGIDTSIGVWHFGTTAAATAPYRVAVPFGRITERVGGKLRREAMADANNRYRAVNGAGTPLYESVLRGRAEMQRRVAPDTVTLVVVITDGQDEQSPFSMSQAEFALKLAATPTNKPVPVYAIGYGAGADMDALHAMAEATGGKAVPCPDPTKLASAMAQVFMAVRQGG